MEKLLIRNKFLVIVPVYNSKDYIEKCLLSILNQDYKNYKLVVVDDCSTDGTSEIIKSIWERYNKCFMYHRREERIASPIGNFVKAVELNPGSGEDILVTVDGDDWLYFKGVLSYLNEIYQERQIWLTYGSFTSVSKKMENFCRRIENPIRYYRRRHPWVTSHLRTIKRKLFDKIDKEDLKDTKTGQYYMHYGDAAYFYPAIEMATRRHLRFINRILYVYNDESFVCRKNDVLTTVGDFSEIRHEIKHRIRYPEVDRL